MRFASLGSGSRGNALVVEANQTTVLLDCGFSLRSTLLRLSRLGVRPDDLSAILVTHEHSDHIQGVLRLAERFDLPVFMTAGAQRSMPGADQYRHCRLLESNEEAFTFNGLKVQPFVVPHDAAEPVQYAFSDGKSRLGVLTDVGEITPHIIEKVGVCDALVVECNHDAELLGRSPYPAWLKRRIAGGYGHLENRQAADFLRNTDTSRLQHIVAAHLSAENNRKELAVLALADALGCESEWICVADQESGFSWREIL